MLVINLYRFLFIIILTVAQLFTFSIAIANNQYSNFKNICIDNIDWSKKKCLFKQHSTHYSPDPVADRAIFSNAWAIITMATDVMRSISKTLSPSTECPQHQTGETIFLNVVSDLNNVKKASNLSQCQLACLTVCAGMKLIHYDDSQKSDIFRKAKFTFSSTYSAIENGWGVCSEKGRITEKLAEEMGISTRLIRSIENGHLYVKMKINDKWYYTDPTRFYGNCEFYPIDKNDNSKETTKPLGLL